ncbi:glycosyltransferase family 2 protein [Pseudoalteromonas umbrosa]|uniref:glycosyltransferase family 2 protein n=1 Tax=Pseudoalteromonas umbrosa TaxID=3048489 RepID=UPI0024C2A3E4|nr:glycosyltransferase family 2 protein [Pseudoalteromonas sp. B95]MDK1288236.1 glycosyltransferase family 2 protein [Pseudoalteromonas sp. B95]
MKKEDTPYFSIVIPTYNREKMLKNAIHSVLVQDFKSYEIIVVNDASSHQYDRSYFDSIEGLHYIENHQNKGQAESRNIAARVAKGRYLLFLDDDDCFTDGFLRKTYQYHANKNFNIDVSWSQGINVSIENGKEKFEPIVWPEECQSDKYAPVRFLRSGLGFGVCIRKDIFEKVGGIDTKYKFLEDTELFIRLMYYNYIPHEIKNAEVYIHKHNETQLTKEVKNFKYRIAECKSLLNLYRDYYAVNFHSKADLHWYMREMELEIMKSQPDLVS